jgi:adenylate cyclase
MVLWNAPEAVARHPVAACQGALACAAATDALGESAWWRAAALPRWRTRFGLHTGRVLVGNFGAPERLSYTAMGDGVNLAARLEGLNKIYGTSILISEDLRDQIGDAFVVRLIDRVAVKGKARAVRIYELLGAAGDQDAERRRPLVARFEEALAAAHARRFAHALELFASNSLLSRQDRDGPTDVWMARCRGWLVDPPAPDWDGSWTATTK